ncbi:Uncharacterized protein OS=Pirellula staleyi (strain ATCC 27377 / DSM 6068 / ICPB 4128) GN=Psta_1268 PE=4 SV=1 [Gemmata massiliana]|uniref:Uncharacterized protein n=1 Tax=Gemmata massiliana TaxID=1210884 RepID=A0A6P2D7R3_9BACT|nr:hypothetical protein [Gemmata massiliana]VTR97381.1 Uncharacterized protein OS=Pirellula staleyi (strain ATCC 27377 / DSM 6068 / ICPB 4128) GN=Psta_1268 PE=4 SV=1 [Gemmata massiliana]
MLRVTFAPIAVALLLTPAWAAEPRKEKPTVELAGDIKDEALQKEAPADGVIISEKGWEKLVKAWGIKDAPKVDFTKELLVVGTWRGSTFNITPTVKDGDLTVSAFGTKDLREGFRWKIASVKCDGIKSVKGKELPKE